MTTESQAARMAARQAALKSRVAARQAALKSWVALETVREGVVQLDVHPNELVLERGNDYMSLLERVRRHRVTRFTHLITGQTRDLSDFEVVPAMWVDPELFHWMAKSNAAPWTWAVIVRGVDWPIVVQAFESRQDGRLLELSNLPGFQR